MKHYSTETRNQEIELARKNGQTYAAIGQRYGISACRVMQIIKRRELQKAKMEARKWAIRPLRPEFS